MRKRTILGGHHRESGGGVWGATHGHGTRSAQHASRGRDLDGALGAGWRSPRGPSSFLRSVSCRDPRAQRPPAARCCAQSRPTRPSTILRVGGRELPAPPAPHRARWFFFWAGRRALQRAQDGREGPRAPFETSCARRAPAFDGSRMYCGGNEGVHYQSVLGLSPPARPHGGPPRRRTSILAQALRTQVVEGVAGTASVPRPADEETLTAEEVQPLLTSDCALLRGARGSGRDRRRPRGEGRRPRVDGVRAAASARASRSATLLQIE